MYTVSAKGKLKLECASERMSVREMQLEKSGCENRERMCVIELEDGCFFFFQLKAESVFLSVDLR